MSSEDLRRRFLAEFVAEATEHLDAAEATLVTIDASGFDAAGQAQVMRAMHTIKGAAAYLALAPIQHLAHAFETAVQHLGPQSQTQSVLLETLFQAADALRDMLADPEESTEASDALLAALQAPVTASQRSLETNNRTIENAFESLLRQQCQILVAASERLSHDPADPTAIEMLRRVLATVRTAADYAEDAGLLKAVGEVEDAVSTAADRCPAMLGTLRRRLDELSVAKPLAPDLVASSGATHLQQKPDAPFAAQSQFLRVASERVDYLVDQTGELLTLRNQLQHFLASIEEAGCAEVLCNSGKALAFGLGRVADELQSVALELRLVQLSVVFQRLPRVARDVGAFARKRVRLQVEGGETEIDKGVAQTIADPLVHMLRNAIDHGIEPPEAREAAGKDPEGVVEVRATREGNDILISVRDDGRGIDIDKVRLKAVERGMLTEAAAAALPLKDVYELLFLAGFSTASTVSEISGRGVGMDVVRANVRQAGGDVFISSEIGSFTLVEMRLPIRVSAGDILLVEAAGEWYAIPLDDVRKTMSIPWRGLPTIAGAPAIISNEQVVPLLSLANLLGRSDHTVQPDLLEVVVLTSHGQAGALLVDSIGRSQQVTVKALDSSLATEGISGAAVLADGQVVLVLDPGQLLHSRTTATQ